MTAGLIFSINLLKRSISFNRSFVENFYIFDKTSIFLLLEKTGKRIIIQKKSEKRTEDKRWNQSFMKRTNY